MKVPSPPLPPTMSDLDCLTVSSLLMQDEGMIHLNICQRLSHGELHQIPCRCHPLYLRVGGRSFRLTLALGLKPTCLLADLSDKSFGSVVANIRATSLKKCWLSASGECGLGVAGHRFHDVRRVLKIASQPDNTLVKSQLGVLSMLLALMLVNNCWKNPQSARQQAGAD